VGTVSNTSIPIEMNSGVISFGRVVFRCPSSGLSLCSKLFNNNRTMLEQVVLESLVVGNA